MAGSQRAVRHDRRIQPPPTPTKRDPPPRWVTGPSWSAVRYGQYGVVALCCACELQLSMQFDWALKLVWLAVTL
jgi:hypothetical protein